MQAITNILLNDAPITALIGAEKIFDSFVDQKEAKPYILVLSSIDESNTTGTGQNLDEWSVRVWSVSNQKYTAGGNVGAYELSVAIRTALHGVKGTYAGQAVDINFESDALLPTHNPDKPIFEIEQVYQVFNER